MPKARRTRFAMAYVTAPDRRTAGTLAARILGRRLAACANLFPAVSLYWWKGTVEETREIVIVFKTRHALLGRLIEAVREVHPHDVPCVVSYPMGPASPDYLAWIDRETRPQR